MAEKNKKDTTKKKTKLQELRKKDLKKVSAGMHSFAFSSPAPSW